MTCEPVPLDGSELDEILTQATRMAQQAGDLLLEGFRTSVTVRNKSAIDLVTEFDLKSEAWIRSALGQAFPEHHILAEEGSAEDQAPANHDLVWYVDPLDGTTNFTHGHPFFAVSMGLYRGSEGLVSVVLAPALGLCWAARRGGSTRRNGAPCRISAHQNLQDTIGATGFPYDVWDNPDDNTAEFRAFLKRTRGIRRCGSAAIDLAMVADGTYGFYWEQYLSAWDMAGGALLVLEAGGQLSDYDGSPADPRTGRLVATNGLLHEETLALLAEVRREPNQSH